MSQVINFNPSTSVNNIRYKQDAKPSSGMVDGDIWLDTSDMSFWQYYAPGSNLWSDNVQTAWIGMNRMFLSLFGGYDIQYEGNFQFLPYPQALNHGGSTDDLYPYVERLEIGYLLRNAITQNSTNYYQTEIGVNKSGDTISTNYSVVATFNTQGISANTYTARSVNIRTANSVASDANFPVNVSNRRRFYYLSTTMIGNPGLNADLERHASVIFRNIRRT